MQEIVINVVMLWTVAKWSGLVLFLFSIIALWNGSLPDHGGSAWANTLRWIVWPLFLIWMAVFMIRGLAL
jgi:hypothetical protein